MISLFTSVCPSDSHEFTFVLALCHLSIRYGFTTKASLMHCHSATDALNYFLLQFNVFLPQEFTLAYLEHCLADFQNVTLFTFAFT